MLRRYPKWSPFQLRLYIYLARRATGMQWGLNMHCGMAVLLVFHTGIGEGFSPPEIYI